jgi:hypothetical protein
VDARSYRPALQTTDQAREHPGDLFQLRFQFVVLRVGDSTAAPGEFHQRNALLNGAAGDSEEVLAVGLGEAAVAFGDVGRDRKGRSIG